ncbi:MAG TPA: glycosyltransferase family 2 protein, partial [Acidimicrobiia bacterium]|nr:glycosyltransferase family 2 protein [Acidimicrobiia bacterium]
HDKRMNAYGQMEIGPAEMRWSAEASVLLASRYGRPDLAVARLEAMAEADDPALRARAGELQRRLDAGELPAPLPGAERVAQFVGGEFAVHRFGYAGP